jgi:predicted amidohydrolase YtcJ
LFGRGAVDRIRRLLPHPSLDEDRATLLAFLRRMASLGITAIAEYGSVDRDTDFSDDFGVYDALHS